MKILVFCAMLFAAGCLGQAPKEERPRVLCGRTLAEARMLYCFSTEDTQKRSLDSPMLRSLYPNNEVDMPLVARRSPEQVLALAARGKRVPGLVDECCLKACYVSELLSYC